MVAPLTHFDGSDMWSLLTARAAARPDQPWLVWRPFEGAGRTWTYRAFAADAARVAAGLRRARWGAATAC